MSERIDYSAIAEILTECLHLHQAPVAICFTDSVPEGVEGHNGRVPAGCRFWEDGARAVFATSAADHERCAIGIYTHNLQSSPGQQIDLKDALKIFGSIGYVRKEEVPLIPVLKRRSKYVIYSPFGESPLPADVVILFVNASQTLILSEATQQVENQSAPAMGRPACAVVPQVMNTGRAALSLGCCGARAYLDILSDDVAIFAIPGAKIQAYTDCIQVLTKANALLSSFHRIRRRDIEAGQSPTVKDSLAALSAG